MTSDVIKVSISIWIVSVLPSLVITNDYMQTHKS